MQNVNLVMVSLEHLRRYHTLRPTRRRSQILKSNVSKYKDLLKNEYDLLRQDSLLVTDCYRKLFVQRKATMRKLIRWQLADYERIVKTSHWRITGLIDQSDEAVRLESLRNSMEELRMELNHEMLHLWEITKGRREITQPMHVESQCGPRRSK